MPNAPQVRATFLIVLTVTVTGIDPSLYVFEGHGSRFEPNIVGW